MKILFVTTMDLQIHTFHERTIKLLDERGDMVDVVTQGTNQFAHVHQKFTVPFSRNPLALSNFKAYRELRKIMKEGNYDIISCHSPVAGILGRLASKGLNSKVIYTAHGFHFFQGAPLKYNLIFKNAERIAAKYTDELVTINPEDYAAASQFRLKKNGKVVFIPGVGVDIKGIQSFACDPAVIKKELHLPEDSFVLYSIGELEKRKNHFFVLESLLPEFEKNQKLVYLIAGKGSLKIELEEWIKAHHLEKQVYLLGFREDARRILYACDIFLFPSLQEGLPVSVIEAMGAGRAIIASSVRGSRDLLRQHENGCLFTLGDTQGFLKEYQYLVHDASIRKAIGAQAQKDSMQYAIETVQPMIMDLYRLEGNQKDD